MNQEKAKSNKKQFIALGLSLCFLGGALVYRQDKLEEAKIVSIIDAENMTAAEVFTNEIKIMSALATQFDEISKAPDKLEERGQPVMDLVAKWVKIKENKKTLTAEEIVAETKKNSDEIKNGLERLKFSSMPIPLYSGGQSLMDQVGEALGALIKQPAEAKIKQPAEAKI